MKTDYNFEVKNLQQAEALANFQAIVRSDYFGDYDLSESCIVANCLNLKFGLYRETKKLKDLSSLLSNFIGHIKKQKSLFKAVMEIKSPEEMNKRIGIVQTIPEGEDPLILPVTFYLEKDSSREIFKFSAFNLGLKKSYYENTNQKGRYRRDLRGLNIGYDEIDNELKKILPYQR